MKKILLLLLFVSPLLLKAQVKRAFLDKDGGAVDSAKAYSFILYRQVSDTSWVMKVYDMNQNALMTGEYRDSSLQMKNGRFVYYHRFSYIASDKKAASIDSNNFIATYGNYARGLKEGEWLDLFSNGHKQFVNTFKHNKLDGRYEMYAYDSNTISVEGNYVDDVREGLWHILSVTGNIVQTDIYQHGKIIKSAQSFLPYTSAEPTKEFNDYIDKKVGKLIMYADNMRISIGCDVTTAGKIVRAHTLLSSEKTPIDSAVAALLANAPLWTPGNAGDVSKPIEDMVAFDILISEGKITIVNLKGIKDRYYSQTH